MRERLSTATTAGRVAHTRHPNLRANCTHLCYHSRGRQLQHALRPGSVQLLQQWQRCPPTSRPAIKAIKQAEVTAAAADDGSAKNAGSDTAHLVRRAMAEVGLSQGAIEY